MVGVLGAIVSKCCGDRATPARRRYIAVGLLVALCGVSAALLPVLTSGARAEEHIQIGAKRSAVIRLIGGKSETIRTDRSFNDVIVGDPEIADVVPLTDRALSVLGKKVGTTRV